MKKLLILLAVITISLTGCGTRKKALQKEISELKLKIETDSIAISKLLNEEKASEKAVIKKEETQKKVSVEVKDNQKVQVDEYDANGNLKSSTVVSGTGKATVEETNKKTEANIEKESEKKSEATDFVHVKKKKDLESSQKTKILNVESNKGTFFGFWFWFWLIIIAVAIYLKYRFKTFTDLKKHVLNLFSTQDTLASK